MDPEEMTSPFPPPRLSPSGEADQSLTDVIKTFGSERSTDRVGSQWGTELCLVTSEGTQKRGGEALQPEGGGPVLMMEREGARTNTALNDLRAGREGGQQQRCLLRVRRKVLESWLRHRRDLSHQFEHKHWDPKTSGPCSGLITHIWVLVCPNRSFIAYKPCRVPCIVTGSASRSVSRDY